MQCAARIPIKKVKPDDLDAKVACQEQSTHQGQHTPPPNAATDGTWSLPPNQPGPNPPTQAETVKPQTETKVSSEPTSKPQDIAPKEGSGSV